MDHYREADVNKFVMVGAAALMGLGLGFWGLRTYAQQGLKQDDLEAPWVVAARHGANPAPLRTVAPAPRPKPVT